MHLQAGFLLIFKIIKNKWRAGTSPEAVQRGVAKGIIIRKSSPDEDPEGFGEFETKKMKSASGHRYIKDFLQAGLFGFQRSGGVVSGTLITHRAARAFGV